MNWKSIFTRPPKEAPRLAPRSAHADFDDCRPHHCDIRVVVRQGRDHVEGHDLGPRESPGRHGRAVAKSRSGSSTQPACSVSQVHRLVTVISVEGERV
jgi:hypothetical protein